jgi:riboflavin kinase/FMN adenylyltransferase
MQILESLADLIHHGSPALAITFGNFDGVHLGHQQLIAELRKTTSEANQVLGIVTFIPHPRKILQNHTEGFLLSSYEQRRSWLSELDVDFLIELPFNRDFSTLSATEFLDKYILIYPALKAIYLGWDFAFGANKQGDADIVKRHCAGKGILVEECGVYTASTQKVSSTLIRNALSAGDMLKARELLGRPFSIEGIVVKGEGRGKRIGVPTANLQIDSDIIHPAGGVYVTETSTKKMTYRSVTNIGQNPTFKDDKKLTIETHLIDFEEDLYGETLEVKFLERLRAEKKFSTVNDLIEQIKKDIQRGKDYVLS